jgi:DNA polymerase-3 subunit delta
LLHVLIGEDDFSVLQAVAEIKNGVGDATVLAANTTNLDGQVTLDRLRGACETVPFLADKRLVIVEGLLARFEPAGKSGRKKAARRNDQPDECQAFADYMSHLPEFAELVLLDGRIGNNNPLLRALLAVTKVRTFPLLKAAGLRQWVERRVAGAGGSIATKAVELLVRYVGSNLWIMSGEVDKLVQYTGGRRIEEADVKALVSYAQEASVFAMVDAILEFRAGAAEELLEQLLKQGAAPAFLLVMLSRQVQLMIRAREMRAQKKSQGEIQSKLGLTSDFVMRKVMEQADKYSPARLKEVYHRLLEADLSIKTGRYDGDLALNILIAELGQPGNVRA